MAAAGDFHFYTKSRRSVIKSSRNKSQWNLTIHGNKNVGERVKSFPKN